MMMPGIDGVEVIRRIRSEPGLERVRIIALTGDVTRARLQSVSDAGADRFVAKPFRIPELLDSVRTEVTATFRGKLGGLLIKPATRRLRTRLDPETHGGAYLLGLKGLAVIAHGNSGRAAIANAIRLAARGVDHRVVERLAERLPERVRV